MFNKNSSHDYSLVIASSNLHKIQEISAMLPTQIKTITPQDLSLNCNPDETGSTFLENALIKAQAYYAAVQSSSVPINSTPLVFAEDSGISVDALHGRPGIYSARYGDTSDSKIQCKLLLDELGDSTNRKAHFTCCAVVLRNPEEFYVHQAIWEGEIINGNPEGTHGFGYDPIFYLKEFRCTSASLSAEDKNKYSHRAKAIKGLYPILSQLHTLQ